MIQHHAAGRIFYEFEVIFQKLGLRAFCAAAATNLINFIWAHQAAFKDLKRLLFFIAPFSLLTTVITFYCAYKWVPYRRYSTRKQYKSVAKANQRLTSTLQKQATHIHQHLSKQKVNKRFQIKWMMNHYWDKVLICYVRYAILNPILFSNGNQCKHMLLQWEYMISCLILCYHSVKNMVYFLGPMYLIVWRCQNTKPIQKSAKYDKGSKSEVTGTHTHPSVLVRWSLPKSRRKSFLC